MSQRRVRAIGALLLCIAIGGALLALLRNGGDDTGDRVDAARRYTAQVNRISTSTGDRLTELSGASDYRSANAAAGSTRAYAAGIRDVAARLRRAQPPASVRTLHDALVRLYDQTSRSLDALAARFADATDPVELAAGAQELSSLIQRLATREQELRAAIERGLVRSTSPQG